MIEQIKFREDTEQDKRFDINNLINKDDMYFDSYCFVIGSDSPDHYIVINKCGIVGYIQEELYDVEGKGETKVYRGILNEISRKWLFDDKEFCEFLEVNQLTPVPPVAVDNLNDCAFFLQRAHAVFLCARMSYENYKRKQIRDNKEVKDE